MMKKPLYSFNHIDDIGLHRVNADNLVLVEDDGTGDSKLIFLKDKTGITSTTTVRDLIDNFPANWENVGAAGASDVIYDNAGSGLTATDLQAAIDELDASVDIAIQDQPADVSNLEAQSDINTVLGL